MNYFVIAITLGFVGSLHCVGMCGPIALAIPVNSTSLFKKVTGIFIYNFGRIITYSLLGLVFGALGKSIALAGFQQALSILVGALILISVLLPNSLFGKSKITAYIISKTAPIKRSFSGLFNKYNYASLLSIGLMNGLLPCGLVYIALAGSIATADIFNGALFMILFGLGTLPAMAAVSFAKKMISVSLRTKLIKIVPVYVGTMGLLLILRGMNLGIPYISPKIVNEGKKNHTCCHKK